MSRISLSELARRLGHNKGYVHKLKARGVLEFGNDGLIDEDEARAAIAASSDPSRDYMAGVNAQQRAKAGGDDAASNEMSTPSANANFNRARTMKEVLAAKSMQLDYRKKCGELVEKDRVIGEVIGGAVAIRQVLERLPNRLSERLAAETDAERCHAVLTEEIEAAFIELTAFCERMATQHGQETA